MKDIKLSPAERKNMRDGKPFVLSYQGTSYLITPELYAYAKEEILAGATSVVVLPAIVGNGMEQITVSA